VIVELTQELRDSITIAALRWKRYQARKLLMSAVGRANRVHGHTQGKVASPTYTSWMSMLARCRNPRNAAYADYGGRGIQVCIRWHDFELFLADMGERPDGMTLDRRDNDLGYYKSNCRWATVKVQQNNRRVCHYVTIDGDTKTVTQWSELSGVQRETIYARLRVGKSPKEAVFGAVGDGWMRHAEYEGRRVSIAELARLAGVTPRAFRQRLRAGKSIDQAIKGSGHAH